MSFSFNIKEVPENPEEVENFKNHNMAGLSFNQMYKQSGASEMGLSYKDWIAGEEKLYNDKVEAGKITGQITFNRWMELRWQGKMNNATGKLGQTLKDIGKEALNKVINKGGTTTDASKTSTTSATDYTEPEKRILGMKPFVFWSITTVLALAATYGTIKIIRKAKKS
jgi:hypothetical protein